MDGFTNLKPFGLVSVSCVVSCIGQRFGLKVKEVLYHEKSKYQVLLSFYCNIGHSCV